VSGQDTGPVRALHGLRGQLVSSHFAAHVLPVAFAGEIDAGGAPIAHAAFRRLRRQWARSLGPASGVRAVFDLAAAPLVELLRFSVTDPAPRAGGIIACGLRLGNEPAASLLVAPWGTSLDRQWRAAVAIGTDAGSRWCLCFNGESLRLADITRGHSRASVEFQLDEAADHADTFSVMWALLRADAFAAGPDGSLVDRAFHASLRTGEAVCASLRHGVLESVRLLLNALFSSGRTRIRPREPGPEAIAAIFEQALTIVYRLLFLLFAEARQLVPHWHPIYRDRYTIASLRELAAAAGRERGLWEAIQAISRLAHAGCDAGDLHVTPFNGRLFSPSTTPLGEQARVDDPTARDALIALTTTAGRKRGGREDIAYRDLGVEELGAVYESVLDFTPAVSARGASGWRLELTRTGHARKDSGTFYTPRSLTDFLVRRTLAPLVAGLDADAILSLRIVDPAMGSGAFLVSACRFLAHAHEDALLVEGRCLPGDLTEADRARIRRTVAQRCLFGVDANPRAVQLARLSLWLATLAGDCPLTFLDHHLRTGDSLVGASPADILRQPPSVRGRGGAHTSALPLFDPDAFQSVAGPLVVERERITREPGETIGAVREKERALAALSRDGHDVMRWRAVADLWCACWFWPDAKPPDARVFADLAACLQERTSQLPASTAGEWLTRAREVARGLQFFHWPLEFPEVFYAADGTSLGVRSGFDAVVGNPPWDMIRADRAGGSDEDERRRIRQLTRFVRESGIFRRTGDGHPNRYQLFVERALQLARPGGRMGLVVPSGLATDRGSTALRHALLHDCDTDAIVGFDNRDGVFPIHRSTRFLLLTTTCGGPTRAVRCTFGLRSAQDLESVDGDPPAAAGPASVTMTRSTIARISGEDLAIPDVHSARDLAILERIAARFPRLGDRDGWHARFGRELNATDDRGCFVASAGGHTLPVLEGKDIAPFAARVPPSAPRLAAADAIRRLGAVPGRRLAYRDVASATNRVTIIAARLPARVVTTHTLLCLKSAMPARVQQFLCGVLNSFVANYQIRMRGTTHVGVGPIERLRAPALSPDSRELARVVSLVSRLEASEGSDERAYVQLQAAIAALYELDPIEWRHIVGTFPLIDDRIRKAAIDTYENGGPVLWRDSDF
jgi:Eco57I restriction-modification methylase